jgi:hypothetical protein
MAKNTPSSGSSEGSPSSDAMPLDSIVQPSATRRFAIDEIRESSRRETELQVSEEVLNHPAFTGKDIPVGAWTDF